MGGNALKEFNVIRLSSDEYNVVSKELKNRLSILFPNIKVNLIPAFKNKQSFGDMDILYSGVDITQFHKSIISEFNPIGHVNNGDCLSITYPIKNKLFQVDLIKTTPKSHDFTLNYFSFSDLGNLMGRIYHKMGLKFGHKGLLYVIRDPDNSNTVIKEIPVTDDWNYVVELGKFPKHEKDRFIDLHDVFDYVIESPYFNRDIFLLENRNHISRVRDKKRVSYMLFLKYVENKPNLPSYNWVNSQIKSEILIKLFNDFPSFKQEYNKILVDFKRNSQIHEKYNGNFVREWTGLEGKELGLFMKSIKDVMTSEFIESSDISQIRDRVLYFWENNENVFRNGG